jgi:uncharacterized protein YjbI with pentapeptide repeats
MNSNVPDRIDDYLDQIFGPFEDSPSVAELRIEVRHDLLERLNDLTERGISDEVAYTQIISSVGDIESTIRELAEQDRTYESSEEPDGPAGSIPDGDSPGATWEADGESREQTGFDWATGVAEAVAEGIDAVRVELAGAMKQVEEAFSRAGVWSDDLRRARARDQAHSHTRRFYTASDLRGGKFVGMHLENSRFAAASLRGADFSSALLAGSTFKASDLTKAIFTQADLSGSNMSMCTLRHGRFERTTLVGVVMSYANMRDTIFLGAKLQRTKAVFADMRGVRFADCQIEDANFTGSDLRGAIFDGLALTGVKFDMANLSNASFRSCTLRDVSFHHVSLKSVMTMSFEDTTVDQATYLSLRAIGYNPVGMSVEN